MDAPFIIYGANGYLGAQIAHLAVQQGLKPQLAGRNQAALTELGKALNLSVTVQPLDDPYLLKQRLKKTALVFNCAGPFQATVPPLVTACLNTQTHYLDITGELSV
ncbi:MAG: saccharopine dehydrogenase NADP-binding domain-containing protein, partial [Methylococcaceae bacterium]|nr:saccharopine dehydrogenase NADP-binding domain-containing protein [Methylococcaceae bacterium]